MKTIDDLIKTFVETLIKTDSETGMQMLFISYSTMLRGEM